MPAALTIDWSEVQRAAEMGADFRILARTFGVDIDTIRKRAQRHEWLTPHKLHERLKIAKATAKSDELGDVLKCPDRSLLAKKADEQKRKDTDTGLSAVAETWETRGEQIRSQAWLLAQKSLAPALQSGLMITTIKEAQTAIEMARKATGQFAETPLVSLGIFGEQGGEIMEGVADAYPIESEVMEDSDFWD